jgi:methionyl-tRNA formyltransferase
MRVIFAGTPVFAATALRALIDAGHEICLVLTQPDRPAGRGMQLQASPVKQLALAHELRIAQPEHLRDEASQAMLAACDAEVMVVAAYGLLLPQAVLDIPKFGCLNIHASLLPRWRGAAPIHRAIEAGDAQTGVGIMQMEAGLDTGPVCLEAVTLIADEDTTGMLHDRLAVMGGALIVDALRGLASQSLVWRVQSSDGLVYAHKITKEQARLVWAGAAVALARQVRAFNPFPGAWTMINDQLVKVWQVAVIDVDTLASVEHVAGSIVAVGPDGVDVQCGVGVLRLCELQRAGGKRLPAATLVQSGHFNLGELFV